MPATSEELVGVVGGFAVRADRAVPGRPSGFVVVGPGVSAEEATAFLMWLGGHGRGSYTQRAYALGLVHFLSWLDRTGVELVDVDRRVVGDYVVAFRAGVEDELALGRQPRTVNHRLCVLASFFEFLAMRDCDRGWGVWAGAAVPGAGRSVADGRLAWDAGTRPGAPRPAG